MNLSTVPCSAVGSESDCTDCRSRGRRFDHGPIQYFYGDHFYGHSPPSADLGRVVVSYKRKYVHEVLVNSLVKLAQEKKCG